MSFISAAIIGGLATVGGGMISSNATKKSQQGANNTNIQLATDKNNFDWNSYLLQRGLNANGAPAGTIPANAGATNTFLPLWATAGGQPAEQAILNQILGLGGFSVGSPGPRPIKDLLSSDDALLAYYNSEPAFASEYNRNRAATGDRRAPLEWLRDHISAYPDEMTRFQSFSNAVPVQGEDATIDDASSSATTFTGVDPAYADLQRKAIDTVSGLFDGRFLNQEYGALGPILAARQKAAQDIFSASETGARSIYDADLLQADTYGQSALEALNRVLAQNSAQRARQGFTGSGSGNALTRARLVADSTQAGAGVRARAGQDLAGRLAQAGLGRATTLGASDEQDALQRLALLTNDTGRRLGAVNLPAGLYQNKIAMDRLAADSKYADLDALLSRLNLFRTGGAPPSYATPNVQPVIGSGQTMGAALGTIGQGVSDYYNTKGLIDALNRMSAPASSGFV